jgi:hypothetical protein
MSERPELADVAQRRGRISAAFAFRPDGFGYRYDRRDEESFGGDVRFSDLAAPSAYVEVTEGDRALRWTLIVISGLALVATFRGGSQPLITALYAAVAFALVAVLFATRKRRRVSYVIVPSAEMNLIVLADDQRDAILARLEDGRRQALSVEIAGREPAIARDRLRQLRRAERLELVPRADVERERSALAAARFQQNGPSETIQFEFLPDRLVYTRGGWIDGRRTATFRYVDLAAPVVASETRYAVLPGAVLIAWLAVFALAGMAVLEQLRGPGYYVGGEGLKHALVDFGPGFVAMAAALWFIERWMKLSYAKPYPGVHVLKDKKEDAIVAELERRRVSALRALAEPDPALTFGEQADRLDRLPADGALSKDEHAAALRRAEDASDDHELDALLAAEKTEPPLKRRLLH